MLYVIPFARMQNRELTFRFIIYNANTMLNLLLDTFYKAYFILNI